MSNITELLKENRAVLWDGFQKNGWAADELVEAWREITREDLDGCILALAAQTTVTDPLKGTKYERSGTWTAGRVWWVWEDPEKRQRLTILRHLHKGGTTIAYVDTENSCAWNVDTQYYLGVASIPALPAADAATGTTYRMGPLTKNEETGRYTTYIEKRMRLYQSVALYTAEKTALVTVEERKHLGVKDGDLNDAGAAITLLDIAATPAGKKRLRKRTRNQDCTQDIEEEEQTATAATGESSTSGSALITEVETAYRHQAAPVSPGAGAAGTINDANNTINDFSRYDAKKVVRTANPMTGTPATSGGPLTTEVETVYRHQAAPVSPGAGAAGTINDVSNTINDFSRYDAKKIARAAVAADSGWIAFTDYYGTNYLRNFRNQTAVPVDGFTSATNNSLSFGTNDFGRYDGTAVRAAVQASGFSWLNGEEWSKVYKNRQGETIYVFEKIASSKTAVQNWMVTAADANRSIIGEDSGNSTDMKPYRQGWYGMRVEIGTLFV